MKKADSVSQDAPLPAWLMNGNRCVWLCGGSWRFWPMWHVYCLGDLGQWSTSGTSHNRVHTSTALRHPTRRVGREREKGKETSGFSLSLSVSYTYAHTFRILCFLGLLGFLQVHLDSDREKQECVFKGGHVWLTALNQNVPCAGWVTLPSCPLPLFSLLFLPRVLPPLCLCSIIPSLICCCSFTLSFVYL